MSGSCNWKLAIFVSVVSPWGEENHSGAVPLFWTGSPTPAAVFTFGLTVWRAPGWHVWGNEKETIENQQKVFFLPPLFWFITFCLCHTYIFSCFHISLQFTHWLSTQMINLRYRGAKALLISRFLQLLRWYHQCRRPPPSGSVCCIELILSILFKISVKYLLVYYWENFLFCLSLLFWVVYLKSRVETKMLSGI